MSEEIDFEALSQELKSIEPQKEIVIETDKESLKMELRIQELNHLKSEIDLLSKKMQKQLDSFQLMKEWFCNAINSNNERLEEAMNLLIRCTDTTEIVAKNREVQRNNETLILADKNGQIKLGRWLLKNGHQ